MEKIFEFFLSRAYAQGGVGDLIGSQLNPTPWGVSGGATEAVWTLLSNVLSRFPYFLGGLAFLALLYSGGLYVFSTGDPQKMEMAKKNIIWTVIGILAITGNYAILGAILWLVSPR